MKKSILFLSIMITIMILSSCNNKKQDDTSNFQTESQTLTIEEKIMGLSMIWKEAQYNFPFWTNLEDLDWNIAYYDALTNIFNTNDIREYYLELSKFITLLRDGHTGVYFPESVTESAGSFPISFGYINGKHYIINCDKNMDVDLYSEVLKINQIDVNDYFEENLYPYFWHEKIDSAYWRVNKYLPIVEYGKEIEITTETQTFKVKAVTKEIHWIDTASISKDESLTSLFESEGLKVELTNDNLVVITIPVFTYDDLQKEFYNILPQIENCKGFIIDVRDNGGGNSRNADSVAQAFIKDKNYKTFKSKSLVYIGTYKAWGQDMNFNQKPTDPFWKKVYEIKNNQYFEETTNTGELYDCPSYLDQPLVILTNEGTASAAEDFLVTIDNINRATIVGSASYGSTGQTIFYDLPAGGGCRICTRWCLYPNDKEFINIGVQPNIYVEPSIDDVKNRFDSVFKKGIDTLREEVFT